MTTNTYAPYNKDWKKEKTHLATPNVNTPTGDEVPARGEVPDPPAEGPTPTVPAKVQVPALTDTEFKIPATPVEGEAPQAVAPVTAETPPGEVLASPEANTQAVLTEVNTPVEDETSIPGEAPDIPAKDETPAKPVEVKVPTMSEEDESPPTTIKESTGVGDPATEVKAPATTAETNGTALHVEKDLPGEMPATPEAYT